jgi:hypothetical protein
MSSACARALCIALRQQSQVTWVGEILEQDIQGGRSGHENSSKQNGCPMFAPAYTGHRPVLRAAVCRQSYSPKCFSRTTNSRSLRIGFP